MKRLLRRKLNNSGGTSVLVVAAILIVIVLAVVLLMPFIRSWLNDGATDGCDLALHNTRDMLRYEMETSHNGDLAFARDLVENHGSFCPGGGEFYVVEDPSNPAGVDVVCGLHDSDTLRRTDLNAENAFGQLKAELNDLITRKKPLPDTVEITLNSKAYTAQRVESEPAITRGTYLTPGVEGTVLYYILDSDGALTYFCYADPDHCARWRSGAGWVKEGTA